MATPIRQEKSHLTRGWVYDFPFNAGGVAESWRAPMKPSLDEVQALRPVTRRGARLSL